MSSVSGNYGYNELLNSIYNSNSTSSTEDSGTDKSSSTDKSSGTTKDSTDYSNLSLSNLLNSSATKSLSNSAISYLSNIKGAAGSIQSAYSKLLKADDEESMVSATKSFVEAYNKMLSSADDYDNAGAKKLTNQLKTMAQTYGVSLSEIGISIENDGSMVIDEKALAKSASDGSLSRFMETHAKEGENFGFVNRLNLLATRVSKDPMEYYKDETHATTKKTAGDLSMSDFSHNQIRQMINYDTAGMLFDSLS